MSQIVLASPREFFGQMVDSAIAHCQVQTAVSTRSYLVELLERHMLTSSLEEKVAQEEAPRATTLAERFMLAAAAEMPAKAEKLRRLGDSALYISGFFGDSLHRKVVDVDYYADIGGSAYDALATVSNSELIAKTYRDLSQRFLDYVDILTFISQKAMIQSDSDLLRLYNRYLITGSKLAEEQLLAKGVLTPSAASKPSKPQ